MHPSLSALGAALVVASSATGVFASSRPAHIASQTAPTPTTVPVPDPNALLSQAGTAIVKANTFHLHLQASLNFFGLIQGDVTADGDSSLKPVRSRMFTTGNLKALGKAQKLDQHTIGMGKKVWLKSAKTHHRWTVDKSNSGVNFTANNNPLQIAVGTSDQIIDLTTVAETRGTTPVWHVHGTYLTKIDATRTAQGTVDYFLAQDTSLPVEIDANIDDTKDGLVLHLTETFSQFGETFTVKAPRVGSKTP